MTIKRTLAANIEHISASFPVLLVTGPRQVGKTTLLETCATEDRGYVSLDDLEQRELARTDPALFLQRHKAPVIIDEIQYAPELFSAIKIIVDKEKRAGMFWLTGSQKFHLMQGITETLAGRVAIIDMLGFSQAESFNKANVMPPFLPTEQWLETAQQSQPKTLLVDDAYQRIWRGSYPQMNRDNAEKNRDIFYSSYIQTYIQRDVRSLINVSDEMSFNRFLKAVAARTAQTLNYNNIARDVDVAPKTIKSWLSIMETSGLIYLLKPYHNNINKRLTKSPKLYFLDTGLCAYLTQWSSWQALEAGAMSGALFETYVFSEILKSYWHNAKAANFYFYRDRDQKEVDLLIEQDNTLYPIEFKKTASPSRTASKHFPVLEKLGLNIGHGAVICLKETLAPMSSTVTAMPLGFL